MPWAALDFGELPSGLSLRVEDSRVAACAPVFENCSSLTAIRNPLSGESHLLPYAHNASACRSAALRGRLGSDSRIVTGESGFRLVEERPAHRQSMQAVRPVLCKGRQEPGS